MVVLSYYDAICSGTIPIIISDQFEVVGLRFWSKIPWIDIAFFITSRNSEVIAKRLVQIKNTPVATAVDVLERKYTRMVKYVDDVSSASRVATKIFVETANKCIY